MGWACVTHGGDEKYLSVPKPGRKRLHEVPVSILEDNIKVTRKEVCARMTHKRV